MALDSTKQYSCPFERCNRSYTRRGKLRDHVIQQKVVMDEAHRDDNKAWEEVEKLGLLTRHTRPKNLTKLEKQQRRKETGKRCWDKNKRIYLDRQRQKRQEVRAALEAAKELTTIHEARSLQVQALETATGSTTVVSTLYKNPPTLSVWLGDQGVTDQTFPRFVTFFYPPEAWPVIEIQKLPDSLDDADFEHAIGDALPGKQMYLCMTQRFHPDKSSCPLPNRPTTSNNPLFSSETNQAYDTRQHQQDLPQNGSDEIPPWAQTTLNAAWDIWKPLIDDQELMGSKMFTLETETDFSTISDKHERLVRLYYEWIDVVQEARLQLVPEKLSMFDIQRSVKRPVVLPPSQPANLAEAGREDEATLWQKLAKASVVADRLRKRKHSVESDENQDEPEEEMEEMEESEELEQMEDQ